jgi:hypothetical protein
VYQFDSTAPHFPRFPRFLLQFRPSERRYITGNGNSDGGSAGDR